MTALVLEGIPAVEASVAAVVAVLQDPDTAAQAAALVAAETRPLVPRLSGKLAASESLRGSRLVWAAPYSVIVQASHAFLGAGITAAVPRLVDLYATQAVEAWDN